MHRHDWLPQEGPSKGEHEPMQTLQDTLQVGVLTAHEGAPFVLRDVTPGFPKDDPPWGIEGEPGGIKTFGLRRPFKAKNAGITKGQTGHKKIPGHTKM